MTNIDRKIMFCRVSQFDLSSKYHFTQSCDAVPTLNLKQLPGPIPKSKRSNLGIGDPLLRPQMSYKSSCDLKIYQTSFSVVQSLSGICNETLFPQRRICTQS
jgi:hypothetical protein